MHIPEISIYNRVQKIESFDKNQASVHSGTFHRTSHFIYDNLYIVRSNHIDLSRFPGHIVFDLQVDLSIVLEVQVEPSILFDVQVDFSIVFAV